jgi:hypothetical protein
MSSDAVNLIVRPPLIVVMLFLVVLPATWCVRWALYALPLTEPSRDWVRSARHPENILRIAGFTVALCLATTLLTNIGDGIIGRDDFHYFLLTALMLLASTAVILGVYYSLTPSSKRWPGAIRLHPDMAPGSSTAAMRTATRKIWFLSCTQTGLVTISVAFCAFRISLYDPGKDPLAVFTLIGVTLAALSGVGFGSYALASAQNYAATLRLINRILHSGGPSADRPGASMNDPLGRTRSDLHEVARRIRRMARGGVPSFPVQRILRHGALRIDTFPQSSRSLEATIPEDVHSTLTGVSSLLAGDCGASFYQRFGIEMGAFDAEGRPAPAGDGRTSRAGQVLASLTRHAEPTDKLLSMVIRSAALVPVVVLAVSGKIGIDKLLEVLK